jgi:hypothetical protein
MENERIAHLPKTPVVVDGASYNLCADWAHLAAAENFFSGTGIEVNLAEAILTAHKGVDCALRAVRQLFPCALRTFHPEINYAAAQKMIDRMVAGDDPSIIQAVAFHMWPAETEETREANQNLTFDFEALADANAYFGGRTGLVQTCVGGAFTLSHVCRIFPCALHRFRPELSPDEALKLMTRPSVIAVLVSLGLAQQAASQGTMDRFSTRVLAVASEEEKQEIRFRLLAKLPWPGAAQA